MLGLTKLFSFSLLSIKSSIFQIKTTPFQIISSVLYLHDKCVINFNYDINHHLDKNIKNTIKKTDYISFCKNKYQENFIHAELLGGFKKPILLKYRTIKGTDVKVIAILTGANTLCTA